MTRISDVRPSFGQPQPIQSMMDVGANEDGGIQTLVSLADPEVLGNALLESGPTGALAQKAMRFAFGQFDPTQGGPPIEWTAERLRKETEGIDPDLWDRLSDARTEFELAFTKADLQAKTQRRIALQQAGWGGVAANVGSQILDPVSIGTMLATGGFGAVATGGRVALTTARLGQLAKLGLINAVPTAATEAIRASEDPRVTGTEIAGNIASDFVFGATAGALVDASRVRRFVGVGSAVGLTNAAFTANDSEAESGQLFAATALGFLIPGAFASIHSVRTPVDDALNGVGERWQKRSDVAVATAAGTPLTDKGLKVYGSVTGEAAIADFDDTLSKMTGVYYADALYSRRAGTPVPPVEVAPQSLADFYAREEAKARLGQNAGGPATPAIREGTLEAFRAGSTSPGSAQQPGGNPLFLEKNVDSPINLHNITDATISRIPLPEWLRVGILKAVDFAKFRFSNAAFVGRSEVPEFRLLGNLFNTDVVPKVDGYAQYGALSQVEDAQRGFLIRHEQTLASQYDRHVKQQKAAGQKPLSFDEFNAAVVKTMRRGGGSSDVTLNAAAKELKAVYDGLLDYAVAHNVPGALKVKEATKKVTNRVPRSYNRAIIDKDLMDFAAKYGAEGRARLEEAWTEAVYRDLDFGKAQQADPSRGKKLANLIAKRIIENAGTQRDLRGVIGGMSKDELARMVREVFSDATPEEISGLAARILSDDDKGVTPLRQRAPLDETYVHRFDDGTSYAIEDRLDSDPRRLFMSDASNMIGSSALIEASRVWTARTGREGFNTIDEMVARLREIAAERGVDPLDTNIERIAWAVKKTLGYPTFEAKSVSSRRAMALMQANINAQYMRLLATPTMGMVNATDVIRATAEFGNAGILKNIPELVSMIERAKKGDIEGFQLLAYMTHDLGIGASAFSNGPIRNLADSNANIDRILSKAQNAASTGADLSARMSGQKITQDVGELMTGWAYIDITTKLAVANQEPSANQLRELGMDLAEWNRVAKQIRQHALKVEETGEAWHPNTDDWTDAEARANYDIAIKRNVRRAMNLVDVTSLPMLADHPGGKLMLQFRKFGLRSAETQLAYHADTLARGDAAVALSRLAMGSALGVLQYTLASGFAVATAAAFGGDPGKVADERFTAKNLALSGFGRAAWSSLLPMGVDIGLAATGGKAVFSPMRVSGIGADNGALAMAFGNPSFDWAANAIGMVESFRAPFDSDYNFSARNVRTIMNGAFVPNILGLRDGINYIAKDVLPERSTNE